MTVCIGIDLGGTKIAAAAVDLTTGVVLGRRVVPTEAHEGPAAVMVRMAAVVEQVISATGLERNQVQGLGIGVPGVIDPNRGHTLLLPNLATGWRDVPAGPEMQKLTNLPTRLINDARAFTLAEANLGAGKGARNVVGITLGTGIGGGIALDGHIYLGIDMSAGCLEAFASGPAIAANGAYAVMRGYTTIIGDLVERDVNKITPDTIMRAAQQGDAVAIEILERSGTYLGVGVSNLITVLSPDTIVIGGGVVHLGDWILGPVRREIARRCFVTPLERVRVVPAVLGGDAGIIGAAVWASQQ